MLRLAEGVMMRGCSCSGKCGDSEGCVAPKWPYVRISCSASPTPAQTSRDGELAVR